MKSETDLKQYLPVCSAELNIVSCLKHKNTQPLYIFNRVRVLHLDWLKEGTRLHSFGILLVWVVYFYYGKIKYEENAVYKCKQKLPLAMSKVLPSELLLAMFISYKSKGLTFLGVSNFPISNTKFNIWKFVFFYQSKQRQRHGNFSCILWD